ncbi:hypothetical protein C5167_016451 [Papaver somniferum]|nr:hypothetical protein C5167_016451 [Papaver somniferum]
MSVENLYRWSETNYRLRLLEYGNEGKCSREKEKQYNSIWKQYYWVEEKKQPTRNFLIAMKMTTPNTKEIKRGCEHEPAGLNTSKISTYWGKLAQNGEKFLFDIHDWSEMPEKEDKFEKSIKELKNVFVYYDAINV